MLGVSQEKLAASRFLCVCIYAGSLQEAQRSSPTPKGVICRGHWGAQASSIPALQCVLKFRELERER